MRLRKPCVLALLRRFGCSVRFIELLYRHSEVFSRPSRVYPKPATPSSNLESKSALANTSRTGPYRRKMLQNGVYNVHVSRGVHPCTGSEAPPDGRTATPQGRFFCSYPQAVDNFVDNHVNCLQIRVLRSWTIALGSGVR